MSQTADDVDPDGDGWEWSPTFVTADGEEIEPESQPQSPFESRCDGDILERLLELDPGHEGLRSQAISRDLKCSKRDKLNSAYRRLLEEGLVERHRDENDRRKVLYRIPTDVREGARRLLEVDPLR